MRMTQDACYEGGTPPPRASRWRRWIVDPVLGQLRQGITPEKIALTIALGSAIGIFPVMGATTFLCGVAGVAFKLNQPILQTINYLLYPVQVALILVFVRIGEMIYRATPVTLSLGQFMEKFRASPRQFFSEFASLFLYGITAWVLLAPLVACALYYGLRPLLRRAAVRVNS